LGAATPVEATSPSPPESSSDERSRILDLFRN